MSGLTVVDKLVLAANELTAEGKDVFSAEDLVVAAWKEFPDTFGLPGYTGKNGRRLYPDSNRVFAEIMGTKPLRKRGYLEKTGRKMYRLTAAGRRYGESLREKPSGARKVGLSREDAARLHRYLDSRLVSRYTNGRADDITFQDVCGFLGISPRSRANELNSRLADLRGVLDSAEVGLEGAEKAAFAHGGREYTRDDVEMLRQVEAFLLSEFDRDLAFIWRRSER